MTFLNINTGIKDKNGKEILLGMYLQNFRCKYLTYQVRIRNHEFVLHTGGSYRKLSKENASNNLQIIKDPHNNVLGLGIELFNSKIFD